MNESTINDSPSDSPNDSLPNDETSIHPPSQLFTVRIWPEVSNQGAVTWRGKVQHVPNGAWRYFQEWNALTSFLQMQIEEMAAPPHSAGSLDG
jgi:hypothetical protein